MPSFFFVNVGAEVATAEIADGAITSVKINVASASAPTSPIDGQIWYDTVNKTFKIYTT